MSERTGRLGSARGSRAGERVPAIANFPCEFSLFLVERVAKKRLFRRGAESPSRTGVARVTRSLPR
jgi:hypothetical protein